MSYARQMLESHLRTSSLDVGVLADYRCTH